MKTKRDADKKGDQRMKYCLFDRNNTLLLRYNRDIYYNSVKSEKSHTFPVMKIAVITEGSADWRFINTVHRTEPGDIVILRPYTMRTVENIGGDHLSCDMFSFILPAISTNDRCVDVFFERSQAGHNVISSDHESAPAIRELLRKIVSEMEKDEPLGCDMALSYLVQAIVTISRTFGINMSGTYHRIDMFPDNRIEKEQFDRQYSHSRRGSESGAEMIISGITDYINLNCENDIDINDLAEMASMSRSTFFRHFRRQTGTTVNKYIQKRRVELVVNRMSESRENILDIALDCGFSSGSAFYSAFRSCTGLSPHELMTLIRDETNGVDNTEIQDDNDTIPDKSHTVKDE